MAKKNWIAGAIKHPGALHEQLGVAADKKIPAKKMSAARSGKYGALAEKRAHLAKTLGSFDQGGIVPESGPYQLMKGEKVTPPAGHPHDEQAELNAQCPSCNTKHEGECRMMQSPDSIIRRKGTKRFDF